MESLEWGRSNRLNRLKNLSLEERCREDVYYKMGYRAGKEGKMPSMLGGSYEEGYVRGRTEFIEEERFWELFFRGRG